MVISAKIRDALAQAPDGMTAKQLAAKLQTDQSLIIHALQRMRETYIDRWVKTSRRYAAVHCLAFIPDDCPYPVKQKVLSQPCQ